MDRKTISYFDSAPVLVFFCQIFSNFFRSAGERLIRCELKTLLVGSQ